MTLVNKLSEITPASVLGSDQLATFSEKLRQVANFEVYPQSVTPHDKALFFAVRRSGTKRLGILTLDEVPRDFSGSFHRVLIEGTMTTLALCPVNSENAASLRRTFDFLVPIPFGIQKSFGCGDRLGNATPGHIRAFRMVCSGGEPAKVRLNLAQQSMRENARTNRTPQAVLDDALWGVFQEGWREGFGADADHLKTTEDIDACVRAGYTFYTFDPGEHVDEEADRVGTGELQQRAVSLPWNDLETTLSDVISRLAARPFDLGFGKVDLKREEILRAAVKYGRVVAHTVKMHRHLLEKMSGRPFDVEMSVDETNTVTSLAEHIYIATELKRLGVRWVSLAPRYPGRFEKGVDYQGTGEEPIASALGQFSQAFREHVAVAQSLGPYKLSLHSGSDKFSLYPVYAQVAGDLVHVKTAGTSYLEAVRAVARLNPALFRDLVCFALERYATDRASYHVSAEPTRVPDIGQMADEALPLVLDEFHARQVLHVTFGSVLREARLRDGLYSVIEADEEVYYRMLEAHFEKHLKPFC